MKYILNYNIHIYKFIYKIIIIIVNYVTTKRSIKINSKEQMFLG